MEAVDRARVAGGRGLERRRAVRVDPEGPQGVVEVEDDEARHGLQVGEGGRRRGRRGGERGEGADGGGGVEGFAELSGHLFGVWWRAGLWLLLRRWEVVGGVCFWWVQVRLFHDDEDGGASDNDKVFGMGGELMVASP